MKKSQQIIEDSDRKIDSEKRKLAEHEESLVEEEKILERITDSLKGLTCFSVVRSVAVIRTHLDPR